MLHTKSQGHWPFVPENKIFKGFLTYMGVVALTLKLIYSHCLIRFNISSENLNAIGSKFDLDVK